MTWGPSFCGKVHLIASHVEGSGRCVATGLMRGSNSEHLPPCRTAVSATRLVTLDPYRASYCSTQCCVPSTANSLTLEDMHDLQLLPRPWGFVREDSILAVLRCLCCQ